jgi:acyl phosphate:glycerol-3-phosphate acyltransferase
MELVKVTLSYLLGSIVGGLVVGRLRGGVDIRKLGSGNAGGTNALRTQGKVFAFWVMVIDIGKGWFATRVVASLALPGLAVGAAAGAPASASPGWVTVACGVAVMLGHVYPIFFGFRGGKGVATLIGAVWGLDFWLLLPMLVTWLVAVILFGFVGLASMLGAVAVALTGVLGSWEPRAPLITFGALTAVLIAFTHRSNIKRMLAGTEPRARRLWLLGLRRERV